VPSNESTTKALSSRPSRGLRACVLGRRRYGFSAAQWLKTEAIGPVG